MGNVCQSIRYRTKRCLETNSVSGSSSSSSSNSSLNSQSAGSVPCATNSNTGSVRRIFDMAEASVQEFNRRYPSIWDTILPEPIFDHMTVEDAVYYLPDIGVINDIKYMPLVRGVIARMAQQLPDTVRPDCDKTAYLQILGQLTDAENKAAQVVAILKRNHVEMDENETKIHEKTSRIISPEEVMAASVLTVAALDSLKRNWTM